MIPKDEYSSGNRDDKCYARLYGKTKEEADAKREEYLATYPTCGYSTRAAYEGWELAFKTKTKENCYYILMRRCHSCD